MLLFFLDSSLSFLRIKVYRHYLFAPIRAKDSQAICGLLVYCVSTSQMFSSIVSNPFHWRMLWLEEEPHKPNLLLYHARLHKEPHETIRKGCLCPEMGVELVKLRPFLEQYPLKCIGCFKTNKLKAPVKTIHSHVTHSVLISRFYFVVDRNRICGIFSHFLCLFSEFDPDIALRFLPWNPRPNEINGQELD